MKLYRDREFRTLVLILSASIALLGFATITEEMLEGDTGGFDRLVLLALRTPGNIADPLGPPWLEEMLRDLTALGGIGILGLLTLAVAGGLAGMGQRAMAVYTTTAVTGGLILSVLLKTVIDRPRPDLVPYGPLVKMSSFPSGHSMMSTVVYLTLGALMASCVQSDWLRTYILVWSLLFSLLVGISRIYLGVHWPTDVLAGWLAGAAWAMLCWLGARRFVIGN